MRNKQTNLLKPLHQLLKGKENKERREGRKKEGRKVSCLPSMKS
jgi:hypothetical protein